MKNNKIYRGNIYWVDFTKVFPSNKHYQIGVRPAIVVSNNRNNFNCSNVLVVPLTTKEDTLPQHTYIYAKGIKNYILPEMLTTIDIAYLGDLYYVLPKDSFKYVEKAVKIQLGLYRGGLDK